jgi:uncharacterized membrane protein
MSLLGLLASVLVGTVFYAAKSQLPFCALPSSGGANALVVNCVNVLDSSYAKVLGVPLDALACTYFVVNIALVCLAAFGSKKNYRNVFRALFAWRFFGIATSAYLISVELFRLRALCVYCTAMHIAIIVDFIIVSYFALYNKSIKNFLARRK